MPVQPVGGARAVQSGGGKRACLTVPNSPDRWRAFSHAAGRMHRPSGVEPTIERVVDEVESSGGRGSTAARQQRTWRTSTRCGRWRRGRRCRPRPVRSKARHIEFEHH